MEKSLRTLPRLCLGLAIPFALAATPLSPAFAHAKLVSADPADGAVVKAGLSTLHLSFSEAIAGKLSGATVADAAGQTVGAAVLDPANPKALVIATKTPLAAGVYKVAWRAVASDDGHRTMGAYSFSVK
jgi:methionine-rich copper-binding protein CopC